MPSYDNIGTITILNVARLGAGSVTPFYQGTLIGLGRIKLNKFTLKGVGSYGAATGNVVMSLFGGISGTPISDLAIINSADLIGSMYLGTTFSVTHKRVKVFDGNGFLVSRLRVTNPAGEAALNIKAIVGRVID